MLHYDYRHLLAIVLLSLPSSQGNSVVSLTKQSDAERRIIHVKATSVASGFDQLITIGASNHLSMGIIIDPKEDICASTIKLPGESVSLGALLQNLNSNLRGYQATLDGDVIHVFPVVVPAGADRLLNLALPTFKANDGSMDLQGLDLWLHIRGIIAPTEGTAYVVTPQSEQEDNPGFVLFRTTTLHALDVIASRKKSGVWVLYARGMDQLNDKTAKPFTVRRYPDAGESTKMSIRCTS